MISFPQPEVVKPVSKHGHRAVYYFIEYDAVEKATWADDMYDNSILNAGFLYLNEAQANLRLKYNKQENARLIVPEFYRALGPDVEQKCGESGWFKFDPPLNMFDFTPSRPGIDFSVNGVNYRRENFRAKPMDVVRVIDGVEYRWPATLTVSQKMVWIVNFGTEDLHLSYSGCYGNTIHETKAGAEQQLAAYKAAKHLFT